MNTPRETPPGSLPEYARAGNRGAVDVRPPHDSGPTLADLRHGPLDRDGAHYHIRLKPGNRPLVTDQHFGTFRYRRTVDAAAARFGSVRARITGDRCAPADDTRALRVHPRSRASIRLARSRVEQRGELHSGGPAMA